MMLFLIFLGGCVGQQAHPLHEFIELPPGFVVENFAQGLGAPRMMRWRGDELFVAIPRQGAIVALRDADADGRAEGRRTVIDGLDRPHSVDFFGEWMYIAQEGSLARVMIEDGIARRDTYEVLVDDIPRGGHWTRTVLIDGTSLYLSIGSSCNACVEDDDRRAAILRCSLDGDCAIFARGSRNAVGLAINPADGALYATENGRDWLGDDWPPEEINRIEEGAHYGWPYCVGSRERDPSVAGGFDCASSREPIALMQAHSAPLGIAFYDATLFPQEWRTLAFVAFHGSWNRVEKTGYKIVAVDVATGRVADFATGWLSDEGEVRGRPVDVVVGPDGAMYVSDDGAGAVFRISYVG